MAAPPEPAGHALADAERRNRELAVEGNATRRRADASYGVFLREYRETERYLRGRE